MVHAPRLSAICCGLLALCCAFTLKASADTFTQSGNFSFDDQVVEVPFTTTTTQTYNFFTTSYAGGTNANGTTTAAGGFDPVLSLFNSDGTIFTGNASSGGGADANLTDVLGPGSYILALTEFPDYSNGPITSFTGASSLIAASCGTSPAFTDPADNCTQRSSAYTINYTSTPVSSSAVTPEPPSALLLLLPLGGVVVLNRRRLLSGASL